MFDGYGDSLFVTTMDTFQEVLEGYSATSLDSRPTPEQLVYVIYTSGTTGVPKGVMVEHGNLLDYIEGLITTLDINQVYSYGLMSTPSADLGNTVLFGSLCTGGILHAFSRDTLMSTNDLFSYFDTHKVDIIKIVPSHWSSLSIGDSILLPERAIIFGGEILPMDVVKKIQDSTSCIDIINHYGPTETTIGKLLHKIDLDSSYSEIPLGYPFSNTGVYILDHHNGLLPRGVVGELCIDGSGLARGYLNKEAITAEKFIDHPFKSEGRLYKTGDLARWLPDGTIGFVGRKDNQVKIRGYRVELEEIESVLNDLYNIEQSVVLAKEDASGSKQLIAYIVSKEFGDINSIKEGLMLVLEEKLPAYMVPNLYVKLDTIPLTTNGKIDRKALPNPYTKTYNNQKYVTPSSKEEKVLVAVCESVLGHTEIGIKDNFYNLGGDSIKSIQVVSRLWQKGYVLKVGDVMGHPILEDMASMMSKATRTIDQSQIEGEVVLTPIQRFLFEDSGLSIPNHYNQAVLLKSLKQIDTTILKSVVKELVKHHDALRMVYKKEKNSWKQYNRGYVEECFRIDYHDLREEKEAELDKMGNLCQQLQSGFNLSQGPLFVIGHFRLSDGDRLALICHHLVIDGISWRILLEDLSSLYTQYISGEKISLPLKTDSFQHWGFLLQEYANSENIEQEYAYWENILVNSIPEFPVDKEEKSNKRTLNKQLSFTLDKRLTSVMQTSIHDVYNTDINDLLLTGLGLAIKNVFGINKSIVNMEGHGREDIIEDVDVSRTIGWYTAVYPMLLEVSNSSDATMSLIQVKDDCRSIPNKGVGYGILKYLGKGFSSEISPTIKFNYLGDFGNGINTDKKPSIFEYSSEYIGEVLDKDISRNELLNVSGILVSGELTITISYCSDEYHEESIQKLIDCYQNNIGCLIEKLSLSNDNYLTPSDLSFSDLTFKELQDINEDGKVEDIYKLSPAQQGMYYHWVSSEDTSLYFNQLSYRISAEVLDMDAIKKAYHSMVDRYAILRTSFINHSSDTLLQVVRKSVPNSFTYEKIPEGTNLDGIDVWINEVKSKDMKKGFNLEDPSQLRFKVLDLRNGEYEFIWSHHHILMDGWCKSILINEFNQILNSIVTDTKLNLPAVNPYSDYINWLGKVDQKKTLDYWKTYLKEYSNTAKIPFVRSDRLEQNYRAEKESIEFSGNIFEKINSLCKTTEVTHNTLIQVVWGYLLSKYNNTKDVVYGSVVSGRPGDLKGIEDMIGLFINTVPVRVKYEEENTPKDLLKNIQQDAITSLDHHYTSLATVQGVSELGNSLLDHIIVFENYPIQEWIESQLETESNKSSGALVLKSVDLKEQANYDFRVTVELSDTGIKVNFKYNSNQYDNLSIKKIADHFYNIVHSFVSKPNQCLSDVNFLSQEEEDFLLSDFRASSDIYRNDRTFIDLFLAQVSSTPDSTAVVFQGSSITYRELDSLSNQLARYLQDHGVGKETLVPICVEGALDMILGILGVLKSGGAYVPIDPNSPQQRLDFILEDTAAHHLLTHSDLSDMFDGYGDSLFVTTMDTFQEVLEGYSATSLDSRPTPEQLVYVIYTSGTTGVPKGVMVEHGNLLDYIEGLITTLDINQVYSYGLMSTPSADLGNTVLFGSLCTGGILHAFSRDTLMSTNDLFSYFDTHKVDIIKIVPSHWSSLSIGDSILLPERAIIFGGEILPMDVVKKIQDSTSCIDIINHYGPTETTIGKLLHKIDLDSSYSEIPLGYPFSNTGVYILDHHNGLLPRGVVGELCIDGSGLARGYLNKEAITAEKFIDHPFKSEGRLYKTGDLARWLPDGTIGFVGRKDNQVKIRGYRVELEEIESVLNDLYNIEQSVVLAKEDASGSKQLIAYIVSKEFGDINSIKEGLMLVLEEKLPAYMVPNLYVKLDTIPLTTNGKIDRKALPVPDVLSRQKEYIAPSTETEKQLAEIWQEVLGIEKIGIKDDFFELGGNSLNAIKINSRIKKKLDLDMEIKNLFLFDTIVDLAFQIDFSKNQKEIKTDNQELKMIEL
ncbi:amino acid adenylation domain-containing protein [Aquimarina muelleri]|uniref:amino acid adenylation domain-containing protein n=1 Tax=Aquimarina muelleri TaxID=279356 RepID=UPI003F68514F